MTVNAMKLEIQMIRSFDCAGYSVCWPASFFNNCAFVK